MYPETLLFLMLIGALVGATSGSGAADPAAAGKPAAPSVFGQPPYAGIKLLSREAGSAAWIRALPEHWRRLQAAMQREGRKDHLEVPFYTYEDKPGPSTQNFHPSDQALRLPDGRCVAVSMCTRGLGDTATGFLDYKLWYRLSRDDGRTWDAARPLIETGPQYSPMHPTRHVWVGKNSFCYGAIPPFYLMSNGEFLVPCQLAPLDAQFRYYNPTNRFTYSMVVMLIGCWPESSEEPEWESSEKLLPGPEQSWRGFDESAVVELGTPGHILCLLRAGDGHQWKALSTDFGRTWSAHDHLTYTSGEEFWTPSSCMALLRHSRTGKVYWVGNICREDPQGSNSPRYPLFIGELDEATLSLRKETVTKIDDLRPGDPPALQLSNFSLVEDASTGHIVVTLQRTDFVEPVNPDEGAYTYVIEVK